MGQLVGTAVHGHFFLKSGVMAPGVTCAPSNAYLRSLEQHSFNRITATDCLPSHVKHCMSGRNPCDSVFLYSDSPRCLLYKYK